MRANHLLRPGYDTVRLYLDGSYYKHIEQALASQNISLQVKKTSPCEKFINAASFEYRENVKVRLWFNQYRTSISFEPAAIIYGNNFELAGTQEARTAILAICGLMKIPVEELRISRLDLTANFHLGKKHIRDYTNLFKHPPYMKLQKEYVYEDEEEEKGYRGKKNGNVYYANKPKGSNRAVIVYQKEKMIRIEMRFLDKVKQNINDTLIYHTKASALYEEEFYRRAMDYYVNSIVKKMCKKSPIGLEPIIKQLKTYEEAMAANQKALNREPLILSKGKQAA